MHVISRIRERIRYHVRRDREVVVGREQRCSHLDSERETDEVASCTVSVINWSHLDSERDIKKLFRELLLITR